MISEREGRAGMAAVVAAEGFSTEVRIVRCFSFLFIFADMLMRNALWACCVYPFILLPALLFPRLNCEFKLGRMAFYDPAVLMSKNTPLLLATSAKRKTLDVHNHLMHVINLIFLFCFRCAESRKLRINIHFQEVVSKMTEHLKKSLPTYAIPVFVRFCKDFDRTGHFYHNFHEIILKIIDAVDNSN